MKNSDKLLLLIARSKLTKIKVSEKLGVSRPTLDKKIECNDITERELELVQSM